MSTNTRLWRACSLVALLALFLAPFGSAVKAGTSQISYQDVTTQDQPGGSSKVIRSLRNDVSQPLRELVPNAPPAGTPRPQRELAVYPLPGPSQATDPLGGTDPVVQEKPIGSNMPSFDFNFEGLSNEDNRNTIGFTVAPPDTAGAIGPDHYIQWVNLVFAIYEVDRATSTATLVYGPAAGNSLWAGFGGECEASNWGDIIVLYDRLANRWLMSQFALFGADGGHHQCVAVSASSDPLGEWYRYDFLASDTKINDYPKLGVWPDAYYMTANQFDENSFNWAGQGVWALERDEMLLGQPANMVYFDLYGTDSNLGGMLPADFEGTTLPPAGAPNPFLLFDDDAWGYAAQDQLQVWEFHVDWATPANSSFTHAADLATEPFDAQICPAFRGVCIDQPNGDKVEDLADRLMYRLQYRNFGDHQTLVVNHSVDVLFSSGDGQAGVRWYELREDGSGWGIYQQGSYAPDSDHRWMGSAAMDAAGNLAVGYSVSSSETFPSIRYTGRLAGDPLNTLPQGEAELVAGSDSQYGIARWGDYSMITLDPLDDCTFWYTQEYVSGTNSDNWGNWFTRVGSFKYPTCTTGPAGNLQGVVTSAVDGTPIANANIDLGNGIQTITDAAGFYQFVNLPEGSYDVSAWAYGYLQETATGVVVVEGETTTRNFALDLAPVVTVTGTVTDGGHGWPLYAHIEISTFGFETSLFTNPLDGSYSVDLLQDTPYTFTVNGVTPGYLEAVRDVTPPAGGSTQDFVMQPDPANCVAPGYVLVTDFSVSEDFEADDGGFTASGVTTWQWGTVTYGPPGAHSGEKAWATNPHGGYTDGEDGQTTSPVTDLSGFAGQGVGIQWWQWLQSEQGFDYASVQVSKDGASNWETVYGPVSGDVDLEWKEYTAILDPSYAVSDFQVRFRFTSDGIINMPGYYVDDVSIGTAECTPLDGGLVVGNVFDANTGDGVVGATVTSDNNSDDSATTFATADDPNVEEGFYVLFSALTGINPFTATASGYGSDTQDVDVAADSTVSQDFTLAAGALVADPTSLEVTLDMGDTASETFTLTNTGGLEASFELTERDAGMTPAGRQGAPIVRRSGHFTPYRLNAEPKSAVEVERPRPIDAPPWMDIADYPSAIMDNAADVFDGMVYSVGGYDGGMNTSAAYIYDPGANAWSPLASMAFVREKPAAAFVDDLLYVTGGWSDSGEPVSALEIYDPGTDTWSEGAPVPTAYAAAAAVSLESQLYIIGGCSAGQCGYTDVFRYDPAADSWATLAPYPEPVSWQACGVIGDQIYCAGGVSDAMGESLHTYVYDPGSDAWSQLVDMPQTQWGMGYVAANGLLYISGGVTDNFATVTNETFAYDPATDTWTPDANSNNTVYRGGSACGFYKIGGDTGGFSPIPNSELYPGLDECGGVTDVPWVSEAPVAGTLPADGGSQEIEVTFDASVEEVDQPGAYQAELHVKSDIPYDVEPVELTMNINPPASWGKLAGTVNGLALCDLPGAPLANATVEIGGVVALKSDLAGAYGYWLEQGSYTLSVSAGGYVAQTVEVSVTAGGTTTTDFDLRLDAPCASRTPESFDKSVPEGGSDSDTLEIANSGAGELTYNILETVYDLPLLPAVELPAPADRDYALPSVEGPASVLNQAEAAQPAGKAPEAPDSGWFGGFDLPGGVVRYASAQCYEQPDSFYVISGVDNTFSVSDKTWRYDAETNEWTELAPIPAGQEGPTAVCYLGKIYAMGGGGTDQFYVYDIATDSWSAGAALPRGSAGAAAGAWAGKVYLIGGDDDFYPGSGVSDQVDIYDIATDSWVGSGASMPVGTSFPGAVHAGPYVYVTGGWGADAPGTNVNATMRYDMVNDAWESGPAFNSARSDFALAVTDQALYAIAGDADGGAFFDPSDLFERLDLTDWPAGAWTDTGDPLPIQVTANSAGFCAESIQGSAVWSVGGGNLNIGVIYGSTLFNMTEGEACYSIYSDVSWLAEDPAAGLIPGDTTQPVTVTFNAAGLAIGEYQASLVLVTDDPSQALFQVPVTLTVGEPSADLSLSIEATPDPVKPLEKLAYIFTASNTGPSAATGVTLAATLPAGLELISVTPSQGSCTVLSCDLGSLGVGESATVEVVVLVLPSAGRPLVFSGEVSASTADHAPENNTASVETTVLYWIFLDRMLKP